MAKREKLAEDDDLSIEEFYDEYRPKLQIDKNAMDDMWLEQPAVVQEIGERVAMEISRRDEAKDDLADVLAELDALVRESHSDDEKKPTETAIKNEIKQDSKAKRAQKRLRAFELNVSRLQNLMESFKQRRYALQDLTTLWAAGYYTSNSGGAKNAREASADRGRKGMQKARRGED
jgi:hypothetical protein